MAAISISWSDLAKVAEVSAVFAIGIVVVFTIGILGFSRWEAAREPVTAGSDGTSGDRTSGTGSRPAGIVLAAVCSVVCLVAAGYGIYLIVPQWGG